MSFASRPVGRFFSVLISVVVACLMTRGANAGEAVGAAVSPAQWAAVGLTVSSALGKAVGATVSSVQGAAVGATVSPALGAAVGAAVSPARWASGGQRFVAGGQWPGAGEQLDSLQAQRQFVASGDATASKSPQRVVAELRLPERWNAFQQGQGVPLTQVTDTVYNADGSTASGTLLISWTAFTTATGQAIAAGSLSVRLGAGGGFSAALAANTGASPTGTYYRVVYQTTATPGSAKEEYWVVPQTQTTTITAVRSKLVATTVAAQFLTRDQAESSYVHAAGDQTVSGTKTFASPPAVPAPQNAGDAANKAYVDGNAGLGGLMISGTAQNVVPDAKRITDGAIAAGSRTLGANTSQPFKPGDLGKVIWVRRVGANGNDLNTTIASVISASQVTLADAASGAANATVVDFGTDNRVALEALLTNNAGKHVVLAKIAASNFGGGTETNCDYLSSGQLTLAGNSQRLDGAVGGAWSGGVCIRFPQGSGGVLIPNDCSACRVSNLELESNDLPDLRGANANDVGLEWRGGEARIENVTVVGFGGKGFWSHEDPNRTPVWNTDLGRVDSCMADDNGQEGFWNGGNVTVFINNNAWFNLSHGFYDRSNTGGLYYGNHTSGNTGRPYFCDGPLACTYMGNYSEGNQGQTSSLGTGPYAAMYGGWNGKPVDTTVGYPLLDMVGNAAAMAAPGTRTYLQVWNQKDQDGWLHLSSGLTGEWATAVSWENITQPNTPYRWAWKKTATDSFYLWDFAADASPGRWNGGSWKTWVESGANGNFHIRGNGSGGVDFNSDDGKGGVTVYDGAGHGSDNVVASFSPAGVQLKRAVQVPAPVNPGDAATKAYVDANSGGNLASPPAIGSVTPNAGTFTALNAGTVSTDGSSSVSYNYIAQPLFKPSMGISRTLVTSNASNLGWVDIGLAVQTAAVANGYTWNTQCPAGGPVGGYAPQFVFGAQFGGFICDVNAQKPIAEGFLAIAGNLTLRATNDRGNVFASELNLLSHRPYSLAWDTVGGSAGSEYYGVGQLITNVADGKGGVGMYVKSNFWNGGSPNYGNWTANTQYQTGSVTQPVSPNGYWYQVTTPGKLPDVGTTGNSQPAWCKTEGCTVSDGTIVWTGHAQSGEGAWQIAYRAQDWLGAGLDVVNNVSYSSGYGVMLRSPDNTAPLNIGFARGNPVAGTKWVMGVNAAPYTDWFTLYDASDNLNRATFKPGAETRITSAGNSAILLNMDAGSGTGGVAGGDGNGNQKWSVDGGGNASFSGDVTLRSIPGHEFFVSKYGSVQGAIDAAYNNGAVQGGATVVDDRTSPYVGPGWIVKDSVTLKLAATTYTINGTVQYNNGVKNVVAGIISMPGSHIVGAGTSANHGTNINAANGLNADLIATSTMGTGTGASAQWWHWGSLEGFHMDGNKAQQTAGNCINVENMGETAVLRGIEAGNCYADDLKLEGNFATQSEIANITVNSAGQYGVDLDNFQGVGVLRGLSGDSNAVSILRFNGSQSATLTVLGMKSEEEVSGHDPLITVDMMADGSQPALYLVGGYTYGRPGLKDVIKVINGKSGAAPFVQVNNFYVDANFANAVNDTVNGRTFAAVNMNKVPFAYLPTGAYLSGQAFTFAPGTYIQAGTSALTEVFGSNTDGSTMIAAQGNGDGTSYFTGGLKFGIPNRAQFGTSPEMMARMGSRFLGAGQGYDTNTWVFVPIWKSGDSSNRWIGEPNQRWPEVYAADVNATTASVGTLNVTSCNGCGTTGYKLLTYQTNTGTLTGNAADQAIYTYSIPGGTMAAGTGTHCYLKGQRVAGTGSITYRWKFGGTTASYAAVTSGATAISTEMEVFNNPGSTTAQIMNLGELHLGNTIFAAAVLNASAAENTSNAVSVSVTFNGANTEQIKGVTFKCSAER